MTTLPLCDCHCHASKDALVSADEGLAGECFCTAECIRSEARWLDFDSRDELVAWLVEHDRNGCHADDECMEELGRIHDLASARESYCVVVGIHASWVGK